MLLWNIFLLVQFISLYSSDGESNSYSVFGEILYAQPTPVVQLQFPYTAVDTRYITTSLSGLSQSGSGELIQSTGMAQIRTGSTTGSAAVLAGIDRVTYKPGQGLEVVFSAIFQAGVALNTQIIGVGNARDGFFFGYNGTSFGILYRSSITGSVVDAWVNQSSWNVDKLDGAGESEVVLVPTAGNVYRIQYHWLGFGLVKFYVQDPRDGCWILVHYINFSNGITGVTGVVSGTLPMITNASMQLLATTYNSSTGSSDVTLTTAAMMGAIQGKASLANNARYSYRSFLTLTALTYIGNRPYHIFAMRNNYVYPTSGAINNQITLYPDMFTIYNTSASAVITFYVYLNPNMNSPFNFVTTVNSNSAVLVDATTSNTEYVTAGILLYQVTVPATNDGYTINLADLGIRLAPGDVLEIAVSKNTNSNSPVAHASLSWTEGC
ncbi:hypothetical protein HYV10_03530 [Candidatus Dependentiae bacterium]|nr:hypothetical protein [Candidatus Dependentiae bacterium]